jgi:uncharacterized protein YcaQ
MRASALHSLGMGATIDLSTARRIALAASGMLKPFQRGIEGVREAVERLGAVQIDTISVVERAHHHVLWSRVPGYSKSAIDRLEAPPRRIFEYWSHAAAYLPIDEYRFCLPRMARVKAEGHDWFRADPEAVNYVRKRIEDEGPLRAQDFQEPLKGPRGWWDWKPAKVALEYLFHAGELVSVGRSGFQKVYDLAERALPADLDRRFPDAEEQAARYVDRAVQGLGIFERRDIAYMRKDGIALIPDEVAARIEAKKLLIVDIDGPPSRVARGAGFLTTSSAIESASSVVVREKARARILSPFDPLIINRKRALRLFGLDYQIECYVPEAKRRFGYFALPILYFDGSGNAGFIGLVDAKADRAAGVLEARRLAVLGREELAWTSGRRPSMAALAAAISAELKRFAIFNGAKRIALGRVDAPDPRFKKALAAALTN